MLDYNYPDITSVLNNPTSLTGDDCSSPEALFFGPSSSSTNLGNNRFTTTTSGVDDSAMSPFSAALAGLQGVAASGGGGNGSSPEYAVEGDSPGLGTEMRGLRINSRFPSPVQGTVRLEDIMLPSEDVMSGLHQQAMSNGSLFTQDHEDNKAHGPHVENGFFQRYPYTPRIFFCFEALSEQCIDGAVPRMSYSWWEFHPQERNLVWKHR